MTGNRSVAEPTAHGLVLGKMYPPHRGHELLVRTAAAVSRRVTVLVLVHPDESLPVGQRVAWLADAVADLAHVTVVGGVDPHPVDYHDAAVWDLHMAEFHRVLAPVGAGPVTAVFTSERYGDELADRFGAVHVAVDPDRVLAAVSGTAVRADPVAWWDALPPATRAGLALRVVVVGAESTGKTTLCRWLTDRLRARGGAHGDTQWVPEVGRDRTVELYALAVARAALRGEPRPGMEAVGWVSADFEAIAAVQNAREDAAARGGGPLLVCDTDAFATGIWHERYLGTGNRSVAELARPHPLYLVADHEGAPFVQDGIRDGEDIRAWMTDRFVAELTATGRRFVVLTGPLDGRRTVAETAVDALLAEGWAFTDPPG